MNKKLLRLDKNKEKGKIKYNNKRKSIDSKFKHWLDSNSSDARKQYYVKKRIAQALYDWYWDWKRFEINEKARYWTEERWSATAHGSLSISLSFF